MKPTYAKVAFLTLLLLATMGCSRRATEKDASQLVARIQEQRLAGSYEAALATARKLEATRKKDAAPRFEIEDASRLVATLEKIVALPEGERREFARTERMIDEAAALFEAGDLDGARKLLETRLSVLQGCLGETHPEVAASHRPLGELLWSLGESEAAEEHLRASVRIERLAHEGAHPSLAEAQLGLAEFLAACGERDEAEALCMEAKEIAAEVSGPKSELFGHVLVHLASQHRDKGNFLVAEQLYAKALPILRQATLEPSDRFVDASSEYARLSYQLGAFARAESLFQEVLVFDRQRFGESSPECAETLANLASTLEEQGKHLLAETQYLKALEIYESNPAADRGAMASCMSDLAMTYTDRKVFAKSEPLYKKAIEIHTELHGDEDHRVAKVMLNLARDLRQQGRAEESEEFYRKSLRMARSSLGPQHPDLARFLFSYGSLLDDLGRYAEAEVLYAEAASVHETSRLLVTPGFHRATFQEAPHRKLANVLLQLGRKPQAWTALQRSQGRVLAELIRMSGQRQLPPESMAREDTLKVEIEACEAQLAELRQAAAANPSAASDAAIDASYRNLKRARTAWAALEAAVASQQPITEGHELPLTRIQAAIPSQAAIVGWLDVEERGGEFTTWQYLLRNKGSVRWAKVAPSLHAGEDPSHGLEAYCRSLNSPSVPIGEVDSAAGGLWSRFAPLASELEGVRELVVIASGAMLGVPVETVIDPAGERLLDRFQISYAPSATILTWLRERARGRSKSGRTAALLVGDPAFDRELEDRRSADNTRKPLVALRGTEARSGARVPGALQRLPGTRDEIEAIRGCFPVATVLLGQEASERAMVQLSEAGQLSDFRVIHIATHASLDEHFPDRSALILSQVGLPDPLEATERGERIFDGRLSALEIMRDWRIDADLVTLSACETGLGRRIEGEGFIGLAHAFLQAGARALVVSLWKVDDRATSLLMRRFYENYSGGCARPASGGPPMSAGAALREAKQWLRAYESDGDRPFEHPYYWSAFILSGDPGVQ